MPRARRIIPSEAAVHIMCRGNNKQNIFNREEDKLYYRVLFCELREENKIGIFHYCLMNNHVHLVAWLTEQSKLSRFMKQVNLCYFNYYRKTYGYSGHLLQDRFKSNIIDTDVYLLQCGKYIELNPVRAGTVELPGEYKFSSYNHYAKGSYDPIITDSPVYIELADSVEGRMEQYAEFVIDENMICKEVLKKQIFIGNANFIRRAEACYDIRNIKLTRGRPRGTEK